MCEAWWHLADFLLDLLNNFSVCCLWLSAKSCRQFRSQESPQMIRRHLNYWTLSIRNSSRLHILEMCLVKAQSLPTFCIKSFQCFQQQILWEAIFTVSRALSSMNFEKVQQPHRIVKFPKIRRWLHRISSVFVHHHMSLMKMAEFV